MRYVFQKKDCEAIKHGHTTGKKFSPTYISWASMKKRCNNKNDTVYKHYGGRGITVCERWNKFEFFLEDMGLRPAGTSIERIDPNKSYYKENCRWATDLEQGNNTSRNVVVEIYGERLTLSQATRKYGVISYSIAQYRFSKLKWDIEKCLLTPKMDINENLKLGYGKHN